MDCEHCGDVIGDRDTRYEQVTPLQGGGQTSDGYCSVKCLNGGVEFSEDEIDALMLELGYDIPREVDSEWEIEFNSNIDEIAFGDPNEGEYHILIQSRDEQYDIEIYHKPSERIYEIVLYSYEWLEGDKVGLEDVEKRHTAVMQRALGHAEDLMEMVEDGEVKS